MRKILAFKGLTLKKILERNNHTVKVKSESEYKSTCLIALKHN